MHTKKNREKLEEILDTYLVSNVFVTISRKMIIPNLAVIFPFFTLSPCVIHYSKVENKYSMGNHLLFSTF